MIKIAILGPESTGKTELTQQLAKHFKTSWVPEYAREYVEKLLEPYTYEDVCKIAERQIEEENKYNKDTTKNLIFFDTELIITKVWFEYKFNKVPEFVTNWMQDHSFEFYLLCAPDLEWEFDPVREHGDDRDYFFDWYQREIEQTTKPYVIVKGFGNQRFQNALQAIEQQFKNYTILSSNE